MSIIENAIDSIQMGIEDYKNIDIRRNASAVRNISAGILLLYKEQLCRLSPEYDNELLIKQNIRPILDDEGNIIFQGKNHKTVDVQSIKDRFKSLKISVDWARFDEINKLRNELEHYYTSVSSEVVREIIAKSFLLIRDFIVKYLDGDVKELLGEESWSTFLNVSDVYMAEEKDCIDSINTIDWKYETVKKSLINLNCDECYSSLIEVLYSNDIYPNITLHCKVCDNTFNFHDTLEECIDHTLAKEAYIAATQGGEVPYDTCPQCDKDTFILSENCCVLCEYTMSYNNCTNCNDTLGLEDQLNEGLCDYCQYKYDKHMSE